MSVSSGYGNYFDGVVLNSPILPNASNECEINFYYYINGSNVGTFDLKVLDSNSQLSKSVWNLTSSQGTNWFFASVNIGEALGGIESGWKIRFTSSPTKYSYFYDSIAIDDISFVNCNPNDYLKPIKCDFETDFCGWENQPYNTQFNWTRNKGETDSYDTGPPGDQ